MKKTFIILGFFFLFSSCEELNSSYKIGSKVCSIDTAFVGVWNFYKIQNFNNFNLTADSHSLVIYPFNKKEYVVIISDKSFILPFKAFITTIGNNKIAHIHALSQLTEKSFLYYPFFVNKDTLIFWGFNTKNIIDSLKSRHKIYSFIKKHYNDSKYFSAKRYYIKQRSIKLF